MNMLFGLSYFCVLGSVLMPVAAAAPGPGLGTGLSSDFANYTPRPSDLNKVCFISPGTSNQFYPTERRQHLQH